jgi:hypothetical protein
MPTEEKRVDSQIHFEFGPAELHELSTQIKKSIKSGKILDLLDLTHKNLFSKPIGEKYINYFLDVYLERMAPDIEKNLRVSEAIYYTIRQMNEDYMRKAFDFRSSPKFRFRPEKKKSNSLADKAKESVENHTMLEFLDSFHKELFFEDLNERYKDYLIERYSFHRKAGNDDLHSKEDSLVDTARKMNEDYKEKSGSKKDPKRGSV